MALLRLKQPGAAAWRSVAVVILALVASPLFVGCDEGAPSRETATQKREGKLVVLATTGMIANVVKEIAGPNVEVTSLMGPGVDPHTYQPTARDQRRLRDAHLVLYNGLHLEGKMVETFEAMEKNSKAFAVTGKIPSEKILRGAGSANVPDPHIWFDVSLWKSVASAIVEHLCVADPDHAADYKQNGEKYQEELDTLHQYCLEQIATIPKERRVLVTSHDAFEYFGRAYGMELIGLQGISTDTEAGLEKLASTTESIKQRGILAIFPESSVSRAAIERVAADSQARLGPELYSDSLGSADGPSGTYVGMIRTNVDTIVAALKDKAQ